MKPRILCWFSCGAASAVAAKLTLQQYGETHDVEVVCCDTRPSENEDNYRFSKQCEEWLGKPITYIRNPKYATIDEVFEKTRYMAGQNGARCTTELKKNPRHEYAKPNDIHVFGFTADEPKRIREFESRNPELKLLWILQKNSIRKKDCYTMIAGAGIRLPEMYLMGFTNNNCPGCVKASSPWYWSMVRKFYPEVFRRRAEQSRAIGCRLVEIKHHVRIFLDELPEREFKKPRRMENLSCGPECGGPPKQT